MYCPCLDKGHCKIDNAVVTNIEVCQEPFDMCPLKTRYSESLLQENKRLRDALERIAGGECCGSTFEAYVDAMIEIAKQALKGGVSR